MAVDMHYNPEVGQYPDLGKMFVRERLRPRHEMRLSAEQVRGLRGNPLERLLVTQDVTSGSMAIPPDIERIVSSLDPKYAEDLNRQKKYEEVINKFQESLGKLEDYGIGGLKRKLGKEKAKKVAYAFNEISVANYFLKNFERSTKYGRFAVQLDGDHYQYPFTLAASLALSGEYPEAINLFRIADSKGHPEKQQIRLWIGWIKKRL